MSLFIDWRFAAGKHTWIAAVLFVFGAAFCAANFYLSFVRLPLLTWRGRAPESIRNISSFPMFGTFTVPALMLAPPSLALSVATLLLMLVDTGSISWFVAMTWSDEYFGGARPQDVRGPDETETETRDGAHGR